MRWPDSGLTRVPQEAVGQKNTAFQAVSMPSKAMYQRVACNVSIDEAGGFFSA
jgi:hypothetical protein